jgi:hypothetical protein
LVAVLTHDNTAAAESVDKLSSIELADGALRIFELSIFHNSIVPCSCNIVSTWSFSSIKQREDGAAGDV